MPKCSTVSPGSSGLIATFLLRFQRWMMYHTPVITYSNLIIKPICKTWKQ